MEDDILNFMKINVDQMSGPFTRGDSLVIYGEFYIRQLGTIQEICWRISGFCREIYNSASLLILRII